MSNPTMNHPASGRAAHYEKVILEKHGQKILHKLGPFSGPEYSDSNVLTSIKAKHEEEEIIHRRLGARFPFRSEELGIATISSLSLLEAQLYPCRVLIEKYQRSEALTEAYHNPTLLNSASLSGKRPLGIIGRPSQVQGSDQVLLLKMKVTFGGWLVALLVVLLFPWAVGVLVGVLTRRVELGFAAMSGMAALVACLEAYVFWACK